VHGAPLFNHLSPTPGCCGLRFVFVQTPRSSLRLQFELGAVRNEIMRREQSEKQHLQTARKRIGQEALQAFFSRATGPDWGSDAHNDGDTYSAAGVGVGLSAQPSSRDAPLPTVDPFDIDSAVAAMTGAAAVPDQSEVAIGISPSGSHQHGHHPGGLDAFEQRPERYAPRDAPAANVVGNTWRHRHHGSPPPPSHGVHAAHPDARVVSRPDEERVEHRLAQQQQQQQQQGASSHVEPEPSAVAPPGSGDDGRPPRESRAQDRATRPRATRIRTSPAADPAHHPPPRQPAPTAARPVGSRRKAVAMEIALEDDDNPGSASDADASAVAETDGGASEPSKPRGGDTARRASHTRTAVRGETAEARRARKVAALEQLRRRKAVEAAERKAAAEARRAARLAEREAQERDAAIAKEAQRVAQEERKRAARAQGGAAWAGRSAFEEEEEEGDDDGGAYAPSFGGAGSKRRDGAYSRFHGGYRPRSDDEYGLAGLGGGEDRRDRRHSGTDRGLRRDAGRSGTRLGTRGVRTRRASGGRTSLGGSTPYGGSVEERRRAPRINHSSNKRRVANALQRVCLAGTHLEAVRLEAKAEMEADGFDNFVILFRQPENFTYRGLYVLGKDGKQVCVSRWWLCAVYIE